MLTETTYKLDSSKCTGCMLCSRVCFFGTFEPDGDKVRIAQGKSCFNCGHCFAVCPSGAISGEGGERSDAPQRLTYEQLMGLLEMRRSRREFKPDRLPREVIDKLLGAAAQAPNGLNKQQVRYTVVTNPEVIKTLSAKSITSMQRMAWMVRTPILGAILRILMSGMYTELQDMLPEIDLLTAATKAGKDPVLYSAPCVILVHTPKSDICGPENAIYAASNILLATEALGLGACVIGFVTGPIKHDPEMKRLVRLPKGDQVHTTIVVGYPEFGYSRPAPKNGPVMTLVE